MSATPDSTLANPEQRIADLERQLAKREAELAEALQRETATGEVLQVINSSPGDLAPVFDAILEKALSLCEAALGSMVRFDGDAFHWVAARGVPEAWFAEFATAAGYRPTPGLALYRFLHSGENIEHVVDIAADDSGRSDIPDRRRFAELSGARTAIWVALRRDQTLLGAFVIYRREVRPFSQKQITLLQNFAAQAVISMENARLLTETREALEQQTATAEVLQVINSSPGDLAPVFDAMLDKALDLCGAAFGNLWTYDGEMFHAGAVRRVPKPYADALSRTPVPPRPGAVLGQIAAGSISAQVLDAAADESYLGTPVVELGHARTIAGVSLRKDDALLGAITIYRQEVRPVTDKQIALLQNFAGQAVIAMENARLLTETREALEQQTATAEVLGVINSSPGNLAPVFEAVLDKAMRLCGASIGSLCRFDGELLHPELIRGATPALTEYYSQPYRPPEGGWSQRALTGAPFVYVPDMAADEGYGKRATATAMVDLGGLRSNLLVPLRKDGAAIGMISIQAKEPRGFSDKQIALLQSFATQAVIAMENARFITETREALEQQTATSEVLQVINSSPGNLQPVFDAMLEKATHLCEPAFGELNTFDGTRFYTAAVRGETHDYLERRRQTPPDPSKPGTMSARILNTRCPVHVLDIAAEEAHKTGLPSRRVVSDTGVRTALAVPLLRDEQVIGFISVYRREVRAFTDKQIALLQNFAAQAVIAMENARLLGELRQRTGDLEESLEYQTATSDVLNVISRSTSNVQPVLDTVAETAARLCGANDAGVTIREGEVYRFVATYGHEPEYWAAFHQRTIAPGRDSVVGRVALEGKVVQIADVLADPDFAVPETVASRRRTILGVPLLREGAVLGTISLTRKRVEPFTERQIELVCTFADQAVIAIENARLLTELQESLEQQTATAEVLQVINSSPGELQPVFEAILEKAHTHCGATRGSLMLFDGETFRGVAMHGYPQDRAEQLRRGFSSPVAAPLLAGEPLVHIADLRLIDEPDARAAAERGGVRTCLLLALRKDGALLGFISCNRGEVRPFSAKEIAFLENFAAQAVIAMDNARLLEEIRQRQAELRVTFDNMGDGVAMFDAEMRLTAWNQNFQKILDLPDEFVAERPTLQQYFQYMSARGEYGRASAELEAEIRHGVEIAGHETRFERTRPDGRVIEVRRNAVPGGGSVLIFSDITERKRSEEEIRAARDAAEAAYRDLQTAQASLVQAQKMAALGQLTAGIAHEIKNPLNFVNNFASLSTELLDELKEEVEPALTIFDTAKREGIDETLALLTGNLEKIAEHGQRADNIVKSMLQHSRGVSGERRAVDLNGLIDEALNLAYHGARAQDSSFNITLERDYAPALAEIELAPQEMTRVFLNLFGNGFYAADKRAKASGGNGYRPTLSVTTRTAGAAIEVRVRDNGTGIAADVRDKLFQPFFTTKPTGEGTGLGLSISYDIVTQQHGGTIEVTSEEGAYTEFTIRLPRH